jgi:light-regulated signal transduction histidine kinase (bacteriophytochrome)
MADDSYEILKLKKTLHDLERKNEELENFVSHATHDIKEPLRSIAIGSEILLKKHKDKLDAEAVQLLEFMLSSAKRFENIVASLKQFTKADSGKLHIEQVDLKKLVDAVLKDLYILVSVTEADITVNELPVIETDKTKLKIVLQHIIDNALKYRGGNHPQVNISSEKKGKNILLIIEDKGTGIHPEHHERIMKPFERLHSKFEIEGTGLGLPLSQKILERLNGNLKIKSTEGEGTTVFVTLPLKLV